ncbi:MAG: hypothetical protein LAO09_01530 [Acidobacteriia bacterium]|nr:hypothetical protein [Terriglobia bacterium]
MLFNLRSMLWVLALISCTRVASSQETARPDSSAKGPKVCVADPANSSMQPIFTDRLKEHLVRHLQEGKVNAYNAYSATVLATQLEISVANKTVMQREKCDYMLLLEVVKTEAPEEGRLAIDFALFKKHQLPKAVLQNKVLGAGTDDPTAAALAAIDNVAAQILRYLPKK